ncbi:MAG: phosphoglycolate phosphatase [Halobacteriales archaeon]
MSRHLAVDVDGTLTRPGRSAALDPRALDALHDFRGLVVVCTGKVLPNALSVCRYVGVDLNVVAETGGVVYAGGELSIHGDGEAARSFADEYRERHGSLGWGKHDLVNRWRETEVAVSPDEDRDDVEEVAAEHGLETVYTGYAYHVKSPDVDKGSGLREAVGLLGGDVDDFVYVGDSENDVPGFGVAGRGVAVANADEAARTAADHVTEGEYVDGLLEALESL